MPTLILTHRLSSNASRLVEECPNIIALEHAEISGVTGTRVFEGGKEYFMRGLSIWELEHFITEVLEP
jgi:hypothetical protein